MKRVFDQRLIMKGSESGVAVSRLLKISLITVAILASQGSGTSRGSFRNSVGADHLW